MLKWLIMQMHLAKKINLVEWCIVFLIIIGMIALLMQPV